MMSLASTEHSRTACVVGNGDIATTCAAALAELGNVVTVYDARTPFAARSKAVTPARDAELQTRYARQVTRGTIVESTILRDAVRDMDAIIIAMEPLATDAGTPDDAALIAMLRCIAALDLRTWPTIVVHSTLFPGASEGLAQLAAGWAELIYAPLLTAAAAGIDDFLNQNRILIGAESAAAAVPFLRLLEPLGKPILLTSRRSAELIKCAASAFVSLKAAFAHEIVQLCEALDVESFDVLRGIAYTQNDGSDLYRSGSFVKPQVECETKGLALIAERAQIDPGTVAMASRTNSRRKMSSFDLIVSAAGSLDGLTIGVWGLTSRGGAHELRDPFVLDMLQMLAAAGASIVAYDPLVRIAALPDGGRLAESAIDACDADMLLVLTDHPEFAALAPHRYAQHLRRRIVIDVACSLDAERLSDAGLTYRSFGQPFAKATSLRYATPAS